MGMKQRGGVLRVLLVIVVVLIIAGTAFAIYLRGPGPFDFAGGQKVALADYKDANPTSVPASMKDADAVKRGEYLTQSGRLHGLPHRARRPAVRGRITPSRCRSARSIRPTSRPTRKPASATIPIRISSPRCIAACASDGARMYPAMPFASYTYMTDDDALAIKAYLFTLAPVHAPARANTLKFPFNQRWAIGAWSAVFNADKRFQPDTSKSPEWNRGAYLSEALAHCGECHTPRNIAFALEQPQEIRRRSDRRLARVQHQRRQGQRHRRMERRRYRRLHRPRPRERSRQRVGSDGRSGGRKPEPSRAGRHQGDRRLRAQRAGDAFRPARATRARCAGIRTSKDSPPTSAARKSTKARA